MKKFKFYVHPGNDINEWRYKFPLQIRQNCTSGNFSASIDVEFSLKDIKINKLIQAAQKYLEKIAPKRPDGKTLFYFEKISVKKSEFKGSDLTRIAFEASCDEQRTPGWEKRCQENSIFLLESFRTKDLRKIYVENKFVDDEKFVAANIVEN